MSRQRFKRIKYSAEGDAEHTTNRASRTSGLTQLERRILMVKNVNMHFPPFSSSSHPLWLLLCVFSIQAYHVPRVLERTPPYNAFVNVPRLTSEYSCRLQPAGGRPTLRLTALPLRSLRGGFDLSHPELTPDIELDEQVLQILSLVASLHLADQLAGPDPGPPGRGSECR